MKSIRAMQEFAEEHGLNADSHGNYDFYSIVDYQSPLNCIKTTTEVTFIRNGYNDGSIKLEEKSNLSVDDFHLDFTHDFQRYCYDKKTKELTITYKSHKMGGNYSVTLYPANV